MKMNAVYIEYHSADAESHSYEVPLSSVIVAFVAQWTLPDERVYGEDGRFSGLKSCFVKPGQLLKVVLIKVEPGAGEPTFTIPAGALEPFSPRTVDSSVADLPDTVQMCTLPSVVVDGNGLCVSGLCSVLRHVLKVSQEAAAANLLGFRGSCLMACAEVSVWTKFCEVDLFKSTRIFLGNCIKGSQLPVDLLRFEGHMQHPLRTHNIGKKEHHIMKKLLCLTIDERKATKSSDFAYLMDDDPSLADNKSDNLNMKLVEPFPPKKPVLSHNYAEDVTMTLADLVIFVCVHHIFVCRLFII